MKKFAVLYSLSGFILVGCVNLPDTIKALSGDPAAARVRISSIYATIDIDRAVPSTNSMNLSRDSIVTGGK